MLKISVRRHNLNQDILQSLKVFNLPELYVDLNLLIQNIEDLFKEHESTTEQTDEINLNDLLIALKISDFLISGIAKDKQNHFNIKLQEISLEYQQSTVLEQKLELEKRLNKLTEDALIELFREKIVLLKKYLELKGINVALQQKIAAIIKMLQDRKYFNNEEIEQQTRDLIKICPPVNIDVNNDAESEEILIESLVNSSIIENLKRYYERPEIKKNFFLKHEDRNYNIYLQNDNKELVYSIFKENKTTNNEKFDIYRIKISKQFSYARPLIPVFYAISEKCRLSTAKFSDFKISLPKVKDTKRAFQIFMALDSFISKDLDEVITADDAKNIFANIIQLDQSENVRDTFKEFCSPEFDEIFMKNIEFAYENISPKIKERLKISRQGFIAHAKETFLKTDDLHAKRKTSLRP